MGREFEDLATRQCDRLEPDAQLRPPAHAPAVFGLRERGANVWIMNRTASAGQRLAKQAKAKYLGKSQLKALMKKMQFQVVINATSVGMDDPGRPAKPSKDMPLSEAELKRVTLGRAPTIR